MFYTVNVWEIISEGREKIVLAVVAYQALHQHIFQQIQFYIQASAGLYFVNQQWRMELFKDLLRREVF